MVYDTIDVRTAEQFPIEDKVGLAIGCRLVMGPKVLRSAVQFGQMADFQTPITHLRYRVGIVLYGVLIPYAYCPDHISASLSILIRFRNIPIFWTLPTQPIRGLR